MRLTLGTFQHLYFLDSALQLALISTEQKGKRGGAERVPLHRRRACVIGAVMCSASFLECFINGVYDYASKPWGKQTKFHKALASVWSDAFDRQPLLAKYQLALALARKTPFQTDAEPYQSVSALTELRNAIAHPKELVGNHSKLQAKLEQRLKGKFKFAKGDGLGNEFFPGRCLSSDCARWAVESAATFALEVHDRLPPTHYWVNLSSAMHLTLQSIKQLKT